MRVKCIETDSRSQNLPHMEESILLLCAKLLVNPSENYELGKHLIQDFLVSSPEP